MRRQPVIGNAQDLLQTPFLTIRRFNANFGQFQKNYDVVVFGPRAGIVVVKNGAILMTEQYRFLTNTRSWEIPGGTVDPGESAEAAAQRECLEETGVYCHDLQPLRTYYPGLDNVDNKTSLFVSSEAEQLRPFQPNEAEVSAIEWMPVEDVLARIAQGKILDAFTLIAVLSYAQLNRHTS